MKGGSFKMGDFGPEHSIDKLPYDSNGDSKPLHKVTLDDFYLSATKATYADFDVYTDVTGQKPIGNFNEVTKNIVFQLLQQGSTGNKLEIIANGLVRNSI